jgi:hypothetical protein
MEREVDIVVLPTPPLPPTNIHFKDVWERMFSKVGGRGFILRMSIYVCGINIYIKHNSI